MSRECAVTLKESRKIMKLTDDWIKIITKVSDVTTWSFTTITVINSIISLLKRHWSNMMIIMLLMLNCLWWCRCHQILIESSLLLLFKLSSTSQLLKRKFERRWKKKWSLMLRQQSCQIHRLREIKERWWDSLIQLLDVITDAFQLSIVRISERSAVNFKTLDRMICIKCAWVLHIENRASRCDVVFQRKTMYKKCAHYASNESFCITVSILIWYICQMLMIQCLDSQHLHFNCQWILLSAEYS